MIYYHCVVYTPFCGEEADVYIADTDYSYVEWKAYDAARENGMEWLDDERLDEEFDEDEYLSECGFRSMEQITENEYREAMRDGEWCV
jgi:hypothetical protein